MLETATADMARKTFVTMGDKYFHFPWRAMMTVTHHRTEKMLEKSVHLLVLC